MLAGMGTRGRVVIAAVVTTFSVFIPPSAHAGFSPPNDDLQNANDLGSTMFPADTGQFIGASAQVGEPDHAGHPANHSVWDKWTAPQNMSLTLSTCNVNNAFDSVLEVYSGPATSPDFTNIHSVASNDDGCGGTSKLSRLKFAATSGTTYYFVVDEVGSSGAGSYEVDGGPTPSNDDFGGALLSGVPVEATADDTYATDEPNEPDHVAGIPGAVSVWWTWTAPLTANYTIQTCNSHVTDTMLAVYTGSAFTSGITQVASNDDSCGDLSKLVLAGTAGTTYRIAVDGKNIGYTGYGSGPITLDIASPPVNDNLANATVLTGFPISTTGDTLAATAEPNENPHAGVPATNSIWYRWTAPSTGPVTIDTCGSAVDTALSIYPNGNTFPLASAIAENNDSCNTQSSVYFTATASTVYAIAIDGVGGAVQLHIHDVTAPTTSVNTFKRHRRTATITFSGNDDRGVVAFFQCKQDGGSFAACSSPFMWTRIKPGLHTFSVRAVDPSGNMDASPATKTFRIRT